MARSDFSAIRHFAQGAWDTTVNHVARMWAGDYGNRPVVIVDGDQPPTIEGEGVTYRTSTGNRVYYPNAYRAAGGWDITYCPSTYRTEVGREWIRKFKGVRKVTLTKPFFRTYTAYEILGTGTQMDDGSTRYDALHSNWGRIHTYRNSDGSRHAETAKENRWAK